ncbi:MAG: NAD(P)/FAD-dependent oxidoreductase [Symploca sp. SIO3E6]|nr:NAD(P)/FAD-dependent oxidoreductase [Caldora sp. SIO3E6]
MMELDIAIIGGGPAGSSTALALLNQENYRIGILESSSQPVFRIGESVPPSIQSLLARLGVRIDLTKAGHLPALGNCSAWGDNTLGFNDFWTSVGGQGWHLDRAKFDRSLLQTAVDRGATVLRGVRVVGCDRASDGRWILNLNPQTGSTTQITASFVVDGSGPRSVFAHWQGAYTVHMDSLLGLAGIFSLNGVEAVKPGYTLVEAVELGWWYAAHLPEDRVIVTLMSDRDIIQQHGLSRLDAWMAALQKTHHVRELVKGATQPLKLEIQPAFSQYLDKISGDGWLAVGDAAFKVDPLSSAGIYKALRSGINAADAIGQFRAGQEQALLSYHLQTQHQFELYLEDRRKYYSQETRWASSPFWKRRQGKIALSPKTSLYFQSSSQAMARLKQLDRHLPPNDLYRLCNLCNSSDDSPRCASEVVAEFLAQTTQKFSAYRPIEALEYLIEQQVIQTVFLQ